MSQPPEVQQLADELARLYTDVQTSLIAQLEAIAQDPNQHRLRARLTEQSRAISQALDEVDVQAKTFLARRFPEAYQYGAMEAAQATGRPFMWSQIHVDAVGELANATYDDLLKSTRFVRRDTKRFIREAVRARSAESVIGGRTSAQVGRALAKELADQGIGAIRYANGAKHTLKDYADMVIRTSTAQAHNGGVLNAGREAGIKWYHVSDGLDCGWSSHRDSDLAAGTVRAAEECAEYPMSHPRCARGFSPAPEVTTATEAEAARQYEPDEQLRLAEEERERARTHTVEGRLTQRERTRREGLSKREQARREREKIQGKAKRERARKREKAKRERHRARTARTPRTSRTG